MLVVEWARLAYARRRLLVYAAGSAVVAVWTLLRFFTERSIFDLVSQQVIVQQWLDGMMSPAHMGQTAYVHKMLLLYVPLELLPGSPRLKLILLTLVINVATFVLIGLVTEKILRLYRIRIGGSFYMALLWLSTVAGSVFWIQFANSRNLEVVGGLLWVYLGLRYMDRPGRGRAVGLAALGAVVFYGDPLQLYMSALPLLVYAGVLVVAKKESVRILLGLCGVTLVAYTGAQGLFMLTGHWLHLSFTDTGGGGVPPVSVAWLVQSAAGGAKALASLFAGGNDTGWPRQAVNLVLLASGSAAFLYARARHLMPRRLVLLVASVCVVDGLVYVASGQAAEGAGTARYLIMLAPVAVLAFSAIRLPAALWRPGRAVVLTALTASVLVLTAALASHWNTAFPRDAHLASVHHYMAEHTGTHVYASIDTAMPLLYLYHLPAAADLPLGCLNGRLVQTHYSMDRAFAYNRAAPDAAAAIVFDGQAITNSPNACTPQTVTDQFGPPKSVGTTSDGSTVLVYRQARLSFPQ